MNRSEAELRGILGQAQDMPYGAAQIALVEQVVAHADAQRLTDLSFDARMQATTSYVYGGEPARAVVTFTWCLAEFDRSPTSYAGWQHTLLWHFKYMVTALTNFPEVSLDRTYAVLDDMQRRWTASGHSPHAVYSHRHFVARHVGDLDLAEQFYRKWCAAPRDRLSDCIGCDPSSKARWLKLRGRDEEAVALAEPVLAGTLTCSEQPQGILTNLLEAYLRTGRLGQARDAHRRAYRLHRPNLADLGDIGDHIAFCARTGNQARAVEILERHLGWLDRAPSPNAEMWFAAAGALALRLAGPGVTLRRPGNDDDVTGERLGPDLATRALEIAGRFDARNRTDAVGRTVRELLEAEPLVDHLPLSPTRSRAAPSTVERFEPPPPTPVPELGPELGPDALLDHLDKLARLGRLPEADAVVAEFSRRFPADDLTVRQRARFGRWRSGVLEDSGDIEGAEAALRQSESDFAALGDDVDVQVMRSRIGLLRLRHNDPAEGLAGLVEATEWLLANGVAQVRCSAALRLGSGLLELGKFGEVLSLLDRIENVLSEVEPATRAQALLMRLLAVSAMDRTDEVLSLGPATIEALDAGGLTAGLSQAHHALALAKQQTDDIAGAAEHADAACASETDPAMRRRRRIYRARLLAYTGRAGEAIEDLADAVASDTAAGDGDAAADNRHWLATAYLNAGRTLDAAEVAEEELAHWTDAGPDAAGFEVRCRHLLAAVYRRLEQPDEAIAQLERAASLSTEDRASFAEAHGKIADLLDQLDRDQAAAGHYALAADAYLEAGEVLYALHNRRRHALSLRWINEMEPAAAALAQAEALADLVPDSPRLSWERAMLDYDAARILSVVNPGDAATRALAAAARFRSLDQLNDASDADWLRARILFDAGRPAESAAAAREGLAQLSPNGRPRPLVELLAASLHQQGFDEQARACWAEYGLTEPSD